MLSACRTGNRLNLSLCPPSGARHAPSADFQTRGAFPSMLQQLLFHEHKRMVHPSAETWVDSPDFPRYEVSSKGRIRIKNNGKIIKTRILNGYEVTGLTLDGKQRMVLVHRIVCRAFHGEPPADRTHVNHINKVRCDNLPINLEWTSRRLNSIHQWRATRA